MSDGCNAVYKDSIVKYHPSQVSIGKLIAMYRHDAIALDVALQYVYQKLHFKKIDFNQHFFSLLQSPFCCLEKKIPPSRRE